MVSYWSYKYVWNWGTFLFYVPSFKIDKQLNFIINSSKPYLFAIMKMHVNKKYKMNGSCQNDFYYEMNEKTMGANCSSMTIFNSESV